MDRGNILVFDMYFRLYQLRVLGFAGSNEMPAQMQRLLSALEGLRCTGASFWTRVTTRFNRMRRLAITTRTHAAPRGAWRARCILVHQAARNGIHTRDASVASFVEPVGAG